MMFSTITTAPSMMMPKVDGAQAHEVAANLVLHHASDGKEHRQGNRQSDDERRPEIPEEHRTESR